MTSPPNMRPGLNVNSKILEFVAGDNAKKLGCSGLLDRTRTTHFAERDLSIAEHKVQFRSIPAI
jgi:hypothetical protein